MKTTICALAMLATASTAGIALAADRVSDAQYLTAARCQGVARAAASDTGAIDSFLAAQKTGRDPYVLDQADNARREGQRQYRKADADEKRRLVTAGACGSFASRLAQATTAAAGR